MCSGMGPGRMRQRAGRHLEAFLRYLRHALLPALAGGSGFDRFANSAGPSGGPWRSPGFHVGSLGAPGESLGALGGPVRVAVGAGDPWGTSVRP